MRVALIAGIAGALLAALAFAASREPRFVEKFELPVSAETVVVDEGDFEPRSVGSYAVRVYEGASKKFPTDHFVTGLIRRRNGMVEAVRFADIDGDQNPEIVVVIRSAGSGGYVSADAFRYRLRSLQFVASIADLEPEVDPVTELRELFTMSSEESASP
jgi:hypothetical protein